MFDVEASKRSDVECSSKLVKELRRIDLSVEVSVGAVGAW